MYTTQNFSPDSKQLITGTSSDYTFRNIQDWVVVRRIERHDCSFPSNVAYSPSGELIALELTWGVLHLVRTDTFEKVALLDSPKRSRPQRFEFSGNGNCLVVFHQLSGEIHIWKIDELRERLALMHLDWEGGKNSRQSSQSSEVDAWVSPSRIDFDFPAMKTIDKIERARQLIKDAERGLAKTPDSPFRINNLAWRLVSCPTELREPQRAVELMEALHRTLPLDANRRNTLAVAYYRAGRFADAIPLLRVNLEEQVDDALSFDLYFLAMCYWKLDQNDRAKETLEWADRMRGLKPAPDAESIMDLELIRTEARELIAG